jgi:hypothetical protein
MTRRSQAAECPRIRRVRNWTDRRHQEMSSMSSTMKSIGIAVTYLALALALSGCIYIGH